MSPAKKGLKTVALPLAKHGFTDIPRIANSSYRSWLTTLLQSKSNKKLLLNHEKTVIDQCFREQAMQQYALDNNKLKKAPVDVDRSPSQALWFKLRSDLAAVHPKAAEGASLEIATALSLPKVGTNLHGMPSADGWDFETYEGFARKVQRMNPETVFTKDVMDAAFRKQVSRMAPSAMTRKGRLDGVLTRCLGKESTEYWKDQ